MSTLANDGDELLPKRAKRLETNKMASSPRHNLLVGVIATPSISGPRLQ
jgi:hypothetical protein